MSQSLLSGTVRTGHSLARRVRQFFSFIEFDAASDCWLWRGAVNYKGYGLFQGNCSHRFAYQLFVGRLRNSLVIDHLCRVRHCVNPRHLEQVTMRENWRRGQHHSALGVCKRGHPISGANVCTWLLKGKEQRCCRRCRMASRKRWYEKSIRFRQAVPLQIRRPVEEVHLDGLR